MGILGRATPGEKSRPRDRLLGRTLAAGSSAAPQVPLILFADDARGTRLLFEKAVLSQLPGYDAHIVQDGNGFRKGLKEPGIHAIISDYHLDQEDGIALLEEARHSHPDAVLVLISAYNDVPPDLEELGRRGIDAVTRKPWNGIAFVRMLQALLATDPEKRAQRRNQGAWQQEKFIPEPQD